MMDNNNFEEITQKNLEHRASGLQFSIKSVCIYICMCVCMYAVNSNIRKLVFQWLKWHAYIHFEELEIVSMKYMQNFKQMSPLF